MGVSFKVSKVGSRFRPKPLLTEALLEDQTDDFNSKGTPRIAAVNDSSSTNTARKPEADITDNVDDVAGKSASSISSGGILRPVGTEVSFTLNLFPDGYSIKKPSEIEATHQVSCQDASKLLRPYDRISESLFSAIESGRLPGDILDDMPCKYVDGALVCEVRDYRKCIAESVNNVPPMDGFPIINKICLRMSLENVVKDIPLISDSSWTYGDLMEVESRILKALQPKLCLDPIPKLDRLYDNPNPEKLNLDSSSLRKKRLRQMAEVTVTSSNMMNGKKVCIDKVPEGSNSGIISSDVVSHHVHENLTAESIIPSTMLATRSRNLGPDATVPPLPSVPHQSRFHLGAGNQRIFQDHGPVVNASGAPSTGQDTMTSYTDNVNTSASSLHGKREYQEAQLSPLSSYSKRARHIPVGSDGVQQQQILPHMDGLHGSDLNWKNTHVVHPSITRGFQYTNSGRYSPQMLEGVLNQEAAMQGLRYSAKEEPIEMEKLDRPDFNRSKNDLHMVETEPNQLDLQQSRLQSKLPQAFGRSNFSQLSWHNLSQNIEDLRKEEQIHKKKSVQSPRVSAGASVQSPLSSKSGEFSSGSLGHQFGAPATTTVLGSSQKEKAAVTSGYSGGGAPSLTSSVNDSMQRQHHVQMAAKRKTNSLPKNPVASGVGSPASVSNIGVPLNANSPPVGTPPLPDQAMLERFSKLELVAMRHHLNVKKDKVDDCPMRKSNTYPDQLLKQCLSDVSSIEDMKDGTSTRPLSQSLVGGSVNTCKKRVLNFELTERVLQGNHVSLVLIGQTKMIMSEKPNDGTVAMLYGDIEEDHFLAAEDYFPTLPNTHIADLLAAQLCSLMVHDGHLIKKDSVQPKPTNMNLTSCGQANPSGALPNNAGGEIQQYTEAVSGQPSNEMTKPNNITGSLNPSQSLLPSTRGQPSGNNQPLQMSQGQLSGISMPRSQQMDPQSSLQPQQQQQQQQNQSSMIQQQTHPFQRSPLLLASNPLSHLNTIGQTSSMQLGPHMMNKPKNIQLQILQQQQQQQQQPQQQQQQQMQRKMIMGLGMNNNIVSLGGLGNVMGMGTARGMSAPMGPLGQNPMNLTQGSNLNAITQQLRHGPLTTAQAVLLSSRLRMVQNRGAMPGNPQSSITRQLNPASSGLSMLGQSMGRANMSTSVPGSGMGPMGPPKLMTGMNLYVNEQHQFQMLQQQQQQQIQQQQQQQIQQQQQQQQQQETTSPLQTVLSPPQAGSPSTMSIPQQMTQQLTQQTSQLTQQASPQQLSQRTPMSPQQLSQRTPMSPQMSSGGIHPLSGGNPEACPASPQLSSQTLGSVGSIANSPMELQGVNKSNSQSNA